MVCLGFHQEGVTKGMCVLCGKTLDVSGVEVYLKPSGILELGKSSEKENPPRMGKLTTT
jgi:hypothetical protein